MCRGLKVRHYAAHLIDLNEYLNSFPGGNLNENIRMTEMNEMLWSIMLDSSIKQAYVQGFDCASSTLKCC